MAKARSSHTFKAPTDRQIRQGVRLFAGLPPLARTFLITFTVAVLLIGGLVWLRSYHWDLDAALKGERTGEGTPVSTGFDGSGVETYSTAQTVLGTLTVAAPAPASAYKRDRFGEPWADIDSNGCDQRNDILTRDLQGVEIGAHCYVLSGQLLDPYSAQTIDFTRGASTSEAVPIDHVVALSNAWSSGASTWSAEQRVLIANDPLNLQATGQAPNSAKSNKSADAWLPQAGYQCEYVARQISVKAAYRLTVTAAEKQAMERVLGTCPDQPAYRSSFAEAR